MALRKVNKDECDVCGEPLLYCECAEVADTEDADDFEEQEEF